MENAGFKLGHNVVTGHAVDALFLGGNIKVLDIEELTKSNAEILAKNVNGIQGRGSKQGFVLGQIQLGRLNHLFLRLPGTQLFQAVGDDPSDF